MYVKQAKACLTVLSNYLLGQLPLPPPDGFPVVLGPFGGVHPLDFDILFTTF